MFSDIPKPKVISGQVEADIKQSPLRVLLDGVLTIIWRMLFQMGLVVLWGAVIWFFFQQAVKYPRLVPLESGQLT